LQRFTWDQAFRTQITAYAMLIGARRPLPAMPEVIELRSPTS